MPPKRDPLSPQDVATLQKWIESGAKLPEKRILEDKRIADRQWWSLRPLKEPDITGYDAGFNRVQSATQQGTVDHSTGYNPENWTRNEIDAFILAGLEKKKLSPSPPANPRALIRRLSYDLTGLPPTLDETDTFLSLYKIDPDKAYNELVEQLLHSPRYGEQWARHWLDVARYGESHGYDKDKARFNAWPYRDYVINSFNEDKPWTRFVEEQIAGDVLYPDDPEGIVALGFVAAGPWDYIAHSEVGEGKVDGRIAKHLDRDDMISAVFNAFMSTTVQCAQCHNHKFDPVSMEDYYRLHTIFAAVDRRDRIYDQDPDLTEKRIKIETLLAEQDAIIQDIEKRLDKSHKKLKEVIAGFEKQLKTALQYVPEHGYHSAITKDQKEEKWIELEFPKPTYVETIRLISAYDNYKDIGAGFGFPIRFAVQSDDRIVVDQSEKDFPNPGQEAVSFSVARKVKKLRITATKLAERSKDFILALGEIQTVDQNGENIAATARINSKDSIEQGVRWSRKNLVDGKYTKDLKPDIRRQFNESKKHYTELRRSLESPGDKAAIEQRNALKKELDQLPKGKLVYSIATHFKPKSKVIPTKGKPREIRLLHRGDIRTPGEVMTPGAPAFWPGSEQYFSLPENHTEGDRRAALAKYLTDTKNPLLWRSIANRIWLYHMGSGIVDSPNDFGRMGMKPTHPELLDFLAARLQSTDSIKDLHRLIVTSNTYRQASGFDEARASIDSNNRYYWRMNRRKLGAEELRDSILCAAGVLDLKMGGPSFQDFKFKDDHTPKYWYHLHDPDDPDSHRRTIYRFIARSQTHPFLTTLDCADPSQMVAKRDETTTAL
ncbi:MAG: DUF1549 and DUF1553 domain-containing protein, partial [Verrucomicrobiales bacterium]|nr:DUF1549 and DUF1553 domain-containing protein [Verrucomicrobiales bacterium]